MIVETTPNVHGFWGGEILMIVKLDHEAWLKLKEIIDEHQERDILDDEEVTLPSWLVIGMEYERSAIQGLSGQAQSPRPYRYLLATAGVDWFKENCHDELEAKRSQS